MKKIYAFLAAFVSTASLFAQVSTNGGSGLAANYPSLGAAITALNAATINSPVVITATSVTETAPAGGYVITAQGTLVNTIEIVSSASEITASAAQVAGSLTDGVFKLVGADYVTIRNFTIKENSANTTTDEMTNNMTEFGIAVLVGSATNGAQNITLEGNTISLNKTYQNAFGIYSSTAHSSTDVLTAADITTASGGNDNLKVYKNAISNVNMGVVAIGSPDFPGLGFDMGGNSAATANTLSDWGTTALYSAFARIDNKVNYTNASTFNAALAGILAVNQVASNISHNSLTSTATGNNDGTLIGIYVVSNGTLVYPASAHTANINHNTLSLATNAFSTAAALPLVYGIRNTIGDANTTLNISHNNFTAVEHVTAEHAGADTLISNRAPALNQLISYNKFTNLVFKNTGNVILISNAINTPAGGVQNNSYNQIAGTLKRENATGTGSTNGIICTSTATTATAIDATITWTRNDFSNVTSIVGGFNGFINSEGPTTGSGVNKNISYNTVSNISTSGGITGISITNRASNGDIGHTIRGNTLTNFTAGAAGNVTGITTGSGSATLVVTIDSNLVDNLTGAQVKGIVSTANKANVSYNAVTRLSANANSLSNGIELTNGTLGEVTNVYANKIGNIQNTFTPAGASGGGVAAAGIYKQSQTNAATLNVVNNRIANISAPNISNHNTVTGISIGLNGTSTGAVTANLFNNTVFLNATTTRDTSGSSCVMFPGGTSTGALNLRNNILVNLSTPGLEAGNSETKGTSAVLRRITGTGAVPANYAATSNNNLFWANPAAGTNNHLTYAEGWSGTTITAKKNTLTDWTDFLTAAAKTMDNLSVTENSIFLSTNPMDADFLKMNPVFIQKAHNAGASITDPFSVTTDFEGDARNATTPDMGADEYTQNPDAVLPVTYALLNGRKVGADNILTWSTYTEVNNKGFDVQRSSNGVNFETIGSVASKATNGNSMLLLNYSFTDSKLTSGTMYYRLQQKDIDGKTTLSNIVMIADKVGKAGIAAMYPNPARNQISLNINAVESHNIQLMITDANGRQVKAQAAQVMQGANVIGLDVSKLPAGIYNITVHMNELGKVVTQRFIKQ